MLQNIREKFTGTFALIILALLAIPFVFVGVGANYSFLGGFAEWADTKSILIIRRQGGKEIQLPFNYKEVVAGKKPGRETSEERAMTINLGNALNDMAVAPLIYQRALEKGIGTWLEL